MNHNLKPLHEKSSNDEVNEISWELKCNSTQITEEKGYTLLKTLRDKRLISPSYSNKPGYSNAHEWCCTF